MKKIKPKDFQEYLFKVLEYYHKKEDKLKKQMELIQSNLDCYIKKATTLRTAISQKYQITDELFYIDWYEVYFNKGNKECGVFFYFDYDEDITARCFTDDSSFHSLDCQEVLDWLEKI